MSLRLFLIAMCCAGACRAQVLTGRVTDASTGDPLAFVAIAEQGTSNGAYTDIDGYFQMNRPQEGNVITFHYIGYFPLTLSWDGQQPWNVSMQAQAVTTAEVVIRPGENPAERIMRKVIARKDENNPEKRVSFSYDSYNKLVFTPDIDTNLLQQAERLNILDTSARSVIRFFSDKHLFIMESASHRRSMPPDRTEETILANRVSGLRNPSFVLLGTQLQSFSFYGEVVRILDVDYLSPLADGAIGRYLFILEDTTSIEADTVYTISFRPRKGKNFEGLKGQLFIHSNGYAIRNVIAEPARPDVSFQVRIQQQYQWTSGGWFPDQLNSFLRFPKLRLGDFEVIGIGRSYIRNLQFGQEYRAGDFGPVVLSMERDAFQKPDSIWTHLRQHELDERERNTYIQIDSLGREVNLDRKMEAMTMLATGQLPIGVVSLDLNRLFRFNDFEGWRLGAGLHTNDFLSKRFSVGGYYAYGFRDRGHKGGGDLTVHLVRKRGLRLQLIWEQDVAETGGRALAISSGPGLLSGDYYPLFISRMDRYEKREALLSGRLVGNLSAQFFANTQDVRPYAGTMQTSLEGATVSVLLPDIPLFETGMYLRWAPGERLMQTPRGEVRLGGKYPVIHFRFTQGWDGLLGGAWDYARYDGAIEKPFRIPNGGIFSVRLAGGWVSDDLPPSLLYNARGTNNLDYREGNGFLGIAAPHTFETMRTNEFMHSRYAALHLRHNFKGLLFRAGNFNPWFSLVHNMLLGDRRSSFVLPGWAKEADNVFVESGLVVDRLLVSGFSGLGLGVFYRYGPQAAGQFSEDVAVKLSAAVSF